MENAESESTNPQSRPAQQQQQRQQQHQHRDADASAAADAAPVKRRGTVACRRCRRLRSKCIHESASPPCAACRQAGDRAANECTFPRRGERDLDRQFRRRPVPANVVVIGTGSGSHAAADSAIISSSTSAGRAAAAEQSSPASSSGRGSGRTPRRRSSVTSLKLHRALGGTLPLTRDEVLPPTDEVVEGCRIFVTSYFQLGFIPKAVFLEKLNRDQGSVSTFLLASILSISARFTPSLIKRYGGAREATDHFLDVAKVMVPTEMYSPSLERTQAFFLLAISQWGNGDRDRSSMDMGVAVRMAALLKLHCEESYSLEPNTTAEQVVRHESARRVFWMIQSQESLHSGYKTPAPFPLEDITTLLPCNENDFAFGTVPAERAALAGTPPAIANPRLAVTPRRCLFATLIQAHSLWGSVSRKASRPDSGVNKIPPWDPSSDYQLATAELRNWEEHLPQKHVFSVWNLRGWKSESLHLAYLAVTMVLRLTNIVARRSFLDDMLAALSPGTVSERLQPSTPTMANANDHTSTSYPTPSSSSQESHGTAPPGFWANMSNELFSNVWGLHEQIDAFFGMRSPDEGFPQILVFCVYMCGSVSSYLWRYPALCPQLVDRAETMAQRSLEALSALHGAWPTSSNWQKGLQAATPSTAVSPAESRNTALSPSGQQDQILQAHQTHQHAQTQAHAHAQPPGPQPMPNPTPRMFQSPPQPMQNRQPVPEGMIGELVNVLPNGANSQLAAAFGGMQTNAMPGEIFDMELSAFMQGDFHFDPLEAWQMQHNVHNVMN